MSFLGNSSNHYQKLEDVELDRSILAGQSKDKITSRNPLLLSDHEFYSDTGQYYLSNKPIRSAKKRADIKASIREKSGKLDESAGTVWACCFGAEIYFSELLIGCKLNSPNFTNFIIDKTYSEVLFCRAFDNTKTCFIFRFGCVVGWDFSAYERDFVIDTLKPYIKDPLKSKSETDDMNYVWSDKAIIKGDHIHLSTSNVFERLAYSYAFAQSVKLAVFETVVEESIEGTKKIPETLAKTGTINSRREDISKKIGELFVSRFYINLHTDILDTPDIFWDNDDFTDQYDQCRRYLEIPKRVEILNQRFVQANLGGSHTYVGLAHVIKYYTLSSLLC